MTKQLTFEDVEFTLDCRPEDSAIEGNAMASGDDVEDRRAEKWIHDELNSGNQWAWCSVIVTATFAGLSGFGDRCCCSYLSRKEFQSPGGYYGDMKAEAMERLQEQVDHLATMICD